MINIKNITNVAIYEQKTLYRSWFFRIFSIIALFFLFGMNTGFFGNHGGAHWSYRSVSANFPYLNVLMINVAQAIIAIFLASDFLKRDKKLDTTETIYTRPVANGEYVIGKTIGLLVPFIALVLMALIMSLIFNFIKQDTNIEWRAYLFYPLLITIPTLTFILGLAFVVMILVKNQAVTFILLLAYIGFTLFYFQDKMFGLLDYMAINLPLIYSDFIGFADFKDILMHRLCYLLMGIGFIFATIRYLNRLPQTGGWNQINLIAFIVFFSLGLGVGYKYYQSHDNIKQLRKKYIRLNNKYVNYPVVDILSNNLNIVHKGRKLKVESQLRIQNTGNIAIDTMVLSLNPGFKIDSIVSPNGKISYVRNQQILLVVPENPLQPRRRLLFNLYYSGIPDENIAYLDIPKRRLNNQKRLGPMYIDKKPGIIHPDFLVLTPESQWYPYAGVGFNDSTQLIRKNDFVNYTLQVETRKKLMPVSQGAVSKIDSNIYAFKPENPLNAISLVIGPFVKKSLTVNDINFNIYLKKDHDFFSSYFSEIKDTLGSILKDELENYEYDELDLYYSFNRFNIVEVPVQFHAYDRPQVQSSDYVMPEMVLFPEKGTGIGTFDFARFKRYEDRNNRKKEKKKPEKEIQTDLFKRLLQVTFFRNSLSRSDDGGRRGVRLFIYDGVNYSKNPYNVFPLFYSYVNYIESEAFPYFNSMIELYLKEGFESNMHQNFSGGMTDNERANLALKEKSMSEIFAKWDPELTSSLIKQTGSFILLGLKNKVGLSEFDNFLYYYLEDRMHREIPFDDLANDFYNNFEVDIRPYFDIISSKGKLPSFIATTPRFIQTRDDFGELYLIKMQISNIGNARGLVDVSMRMPRQGGFGGGGGGETEQRLYEIDAGTTKDIQISLYDRPRVLTINTLISENIPSSFSTFLRTAEESNTLNIDEYEREIDGVISFVTEGEYIVDNEDEGFSYTSVSNESKIKQYIDSKKEQKDEINYSQVWRGWAPATWRQVSHSAFYGATIKSAIYTRKGDGKNIAKWTTILPEAGYYDVYTYIPVSAMLSRPSRSGNESGGQNQNQGQDQRRQGPEFADNGTVYSYTISSNEGTDEIEFKLSKNTEDGWNKIGTFHFPADSATIILTNATNKNRVFADAVKWVAK